MKKTAILLSAILFGITFTGKAQLKVHPAGNISIGTLNNYQPGYKTYVNGSIYIAGNATITSNINILSSMGKITSPGMQSNFLTIGEAYTTENRLRVGGESTGATLYVNGTTWTTTTWSESDKRLKKDIRAIDKNDALANIMKLQGTTYEFESGKNLKKLHNEGVFKFTQDTVFDVDTVTSMVNKQKVKNIKINTPVFPKGKQYGLVAQDVMEIYPELVDLDSSSGIYGINYIGFIPILLEGIKAQQREIDSLKNEIKIMKAYLGLDKKNKNKSFETDITGTGTEEGNTLTNPVLYQNLPNPFNVSTKIAMHIPVTIAAAMLNIYDLQGQQKKSIPVTARGNAEITIQGKEFKPGMYLYALIADGQLVDTKRMVLTE